ncbi:glycerophosphodiester phosphodiesterase [Paenibacillus sp. KN14-4R]|uniref:glycerophosphodiester phosphodiesterase n=1 Tax=Paenibacillus sp. KN14-4R TaxID=3445773 RepID=UPI003F9F8EE3
MKANRPLIIGHRGAAGEAPENTLGSFQLALEQGAEGLELDVHLSKDGQLVVCHDATLDRTTDMTGYIHQLTVEELKKADAGSWFHEKFANERIPLLEEVFDLVPPHIMINVEIKHTYDHHLEPALVDLLRRRGRLDSVVVSSFDFKSLLGLKLLEPEAKIGLLYDVNLVRHSALASTLGVPVYSLHPNFRRIDAEDVRDAVQQGLQVYPYTINDAEMMEQAIQYGVSGIITDYPAKLKSLLDRK